MNDWLEMDLRPLRLGELLDRTFVLYRRRFTLFAGILLLPQGILLAGQLVLQGLFHPIVGGRPGQPVNPADTIALAGMNFLLVILYLVVYIFALGAATGAISDVYLNRPISIRGAYRKLQGRVGSMIGLMVVLTLIASAVFFAAFIFASVFMAIGIGVASLLGPTTVPRWNSADGVPSASTISSRFD